MTEELRDHLLQEYAATGKLPEAGSFGLRLVPLDESELRPLIKDFEARMRAAFGLTSFREGQS